MRSLAIQVSPEQFKDIKLRLAMLDMTLKDYLLSLIGKDLESAKKEKE